MRPGEGEVRRTFLGKHPDQLCRHCLHNLPALAVAGEEGDFTDAVPGSGQLRYCLPNWTLQPRWCRIDCRRCRT